MAKRTTPLSILCSILFCWLSFNTVWATHLTGGAIRMHVQEIGLNTYQVDVEVWFSRSTNGASMSNSIGLRLINDCGGSTIDFNAFAVTNVPTADTANIKCGQETDVIFEQEAYLYTASQTITTTCNSFTVYHTLCCRPAYLQNVAMANESMLIYAKYNSLLGDNENPTYDFRNLYSLNCTNGSLFSNPTLSDPDGDSLYVNIVPVEGAPFNDPANSFSLGFTAPYSISNPILHNGNYSFNPHTGVMVADSLLAQRAVVGYQVLEYRRDTFTNQSLLIGETIINQFIRVTDSCSPEAKDFGLEPVDTAFNIGGLLAEELSCDDTSMILHLSSPVIASSITPTGSEFYIENTKGYFLPVVAAEPLDNDSINIYRIRLRFGVPVDYNDTLTLRLQIGNDLNTLTNICGFSAPTTDSLMLFVADCSGIGLQEAATSQIKMFPNPFIDKLNLETPEDGILDIYNLSGQPLLTKTIEAGNNEIDMTRLPEGVFLAVFTNKYGQIVTEKIQHLSY